MTKILLMEKYGNYCIAKKDKQGLNLEIDKNTPSNIINAKDVVPYGLPFEFDRTNFGKTEYVIPSYKEKSEDYGRINLDITIEGLEKIVKEAGADWIFVDNLKSADLGAYWGISGRAQLLINNKYSED